MATIRVREDDSDNKYETFNDIEDCLIYIEQVTTYEFRQFLEELIEDKIEEEKYNVCENCEFTDMSE